MYKFDLDPYGDLDFSGDMRNQKVNPTVPRPYSLETPQLSGQINMNAIPTNNGEKKILGMSPGSLMAIGGALGAAIGGNTTGGRIGQVASAMGQTQLKAMAAQQQQKEQLAFLKEFLSKGGDFNKITPEQAKGLGLNFSLSGASLGGASGNTGLETGNISLAKLGLLNTPANY